LDKYSKIYIAGNTGMVGSAILRDLESRGYSNFVFTPYPESDLTNQKTVNDFFEKEKPEYVIDAAAKVGGILANDTYRAQFIYENLMIQNNIIHASYVHRVKKLIFLGSSCIYPKNCPQPMKEEYLLTGSLEPTNEPYAIAKIAGIKMCENYNRQYGSNFISVMPTNLYGPGDNYNLETSHVLPALIRKIYLAKCLEINNMNSIRRDFNMRPFGIVDGKSSEESILNVLEQHGISRRQNPSVQSNDEESADKYWKISISLFGTGSPRREFLYVDDVASAIVYLLENYDAGDIGEFINIGTGEDITIFDLAKMIKNIIGFTGNIKWDVSKPDGTPQKLLNVNKLRKLGWNHEMSLTNGIKNIYNLYVSTQGKGS
jgi:GDP-L-fucose synthase